MWSVNPTFFLQDEPASISQAEAQAIATAVTAIAIPTQLRNIVNTATTFTGTRVEARDRNGLLEALGESVRAVPTAGAGNTPHPYQTSIVSSLRSGFPGGQGRGRLYWPATSFTVSSTTLRGDAATVTATLSAIKTYLGQIQAAVAVSAGPCDLAVWSRAGTAFHKVISIRMGDVLDVQRRRRDTLSEAYSELTYP